MIEIMTVFINEIKYELKYYIYLIIHKRFFN